MVLQNLFIEFLKKKNKIQENENRRVRREIKIGGDGLELKKLY
jgi:hypothetical protein